MTGQHNCRAGKSSCAPIAMCETRVAPQPGGPDSLPRTPAILDALLTA